MFAFRKPVFIVLLLAIVSAIAVGQTRPEDVVTDDYIIRYVSHKEPKGESEKMLRSISSGNSGNALKSFFSQAFGGDDESLSVSSNEEEIVWWKGGGKRIQDLGERYFAAYVSRGQILVHTRGSIEILIKRESKDGRPTEEVGFLLATKDEGGGASYLLKSTLPYESVRVAYRGIDGKKKYVTLYG